MALPAGAQIDGTGERRQRGGMRSLLLILAVLASCSEAEVAERSRSGGGREAGAAAVPKIVLQGRVTDAAGILDPSQEASLTARLHQFERTSGHQLVVVTAASLDGQDVKRFTTDLGNAWGIGSAERDDGIILLIAPNERKARIAIGSGLERTFPDALCARIMADEIIPRFREGDLPGGIEAGVTALIKNAGA